MLIPLTSNNFFITQGRKGPILCSRIKGLSITLFYSTKCQNCKRLLPVYNSLASGVRNIQFTAINVGKYRDVAQHSRATLTRIEYVPFIIIYVNGIPFMQYDGPKTYENLFSFLNGVIQHITSRQPYTKSGQVHRRKVEKSEMEQFIERMKKLHGVPYNILDDDYEIIDGAYRNQGSKNFARVNRRDDPSNAYSEQLGRRAGFIGY
jgi:thiol-disulfide isomerase/thioredoxin